MKKLSRWLSFLAVLVSGLSAAPGAEEFGGATPLAWSERMAQSEMTRRGDSLFFDRNPRARWDYTTSLFGLALMKLADAAHQPALAEYGGRTAESFLTPEGGIETYKPDEFNLDLIPPGKVLLRRYEQGHHEARITQALETLRHQLALQPRTSEGGFWHKQRYPHQMWLDGLFMATPFLAEYGKDFAEPAAFDEVARQILLTDRHTYDPKTGLYFHAWDEKHEQSWADKQTGDSPNIWGRAVGWYAMAIVDSLDYLPPVHPEVDHISAVFRRVADGIVRWQDPASGLWWQVMDQGDRAGNYREATASCMFVYALAKGINHGYLPRDKFLPAVLKGYAGIIRDLVRTDADGAVSLTQCCEVAGLGYTNAKGQPRDGSFGYYVSEPVVANDLKGVGPFILAGIEVQRLLAGEASPPVVRGWDDLDPVLARIKAPTFPARDFVITDYGAKPGAEATAAIRAAIAACTAAGGGRVVIPAGDWPTGAIELKSNVNLHVSKGATVHFLFDPAKYPVVYTRWEGTECMNLSAFVYAFEQENIAVTGPGTLDGGANDATWWSWNLKDGSPRKQKTDRDALVAMGEKGVPVAERVFGPGHFLRPNFIQPYRCRNILIEDVHIVASPMWEINPVLSQNITVRGVSISTLGPNNDGFDPECSRDMLVEHCTFETGDDCIAIKSGRNNDGRRVNVPCENIVIRQCVMKDGHGGVVLGSECTGGIRNVFVEDCTMDAPNLERVLRFKDNAARGGTLENVFMRNIKIGRVKEAVLTIDLLYEEGAKGGFPAIVRNIQLDHLTSTGSPRVFYLRGYEGAVIENIRLSDCTFNGVTATDVIQHVGTIVLTNVTVTPGKVPASLSTRSATDE